MKLINQSFEIEDCIDGMSILRKLERIGRVAYKSEDLITKDSCLNFIKGIIKRGHESVLEHVSITVKVITDRGISHEIVRHRIASYTQESTRYCNYSKGKFNGELTFIQPVDYILSQLDYDTLYLIEGQYCRAIQYEGKTPQQARYFLPNGLKTELYMTMNLREWRHFFKLRTAPTAHPQMQDLAKIILKKFQELIPIIFEDITF